MPIISTGLGELVIDRLRVDARTAPLGIDNPTPEFSWMLGGDGQQKACQVQVSTKPGLDAGIVWDSGRLETAQPFGLRYAGAELASFHPYYWRVRVWTQDDVAVWSSWASFETGVLDPSLWTAKWITGPTKENDGDRAALYLRGVFNLEIPVRCARAYVSALGWYRFFINGTDCTGNALVPRWTPFDHVVEYQAYDITDLFRKGGNVAAIAIGDGRFRGRTGISDRREIYGDRLAGLVQIELECEDGSHRTFVSNEAWEAGHGRILKSDPKRGELADYRISTRDWLHTTGPVKGFTQASMLPPGHRQLIGEEVERVCEVDLLGCKRIWRTPSGKQIADFGQNFAGVVRIRLANVPAGHKVTLTFSEVVGQNGELDHDYLTTGMLSTHPPQRDTFIADGSDDWYQPWFTIHGFRYVEIDGLDGDLPSGDVEGIVLSTNLEKSGSFECSDDRLNQLYRNVCWSMRSNFTDTPTDCPTRERSGWTGDIQVFADTAMVIADIQAYLRRYLRNLGIEQFPDGSIPPYIPSDGSEYSSPMPRTMRSTATSAGWGDASVMLPAALYQHYGDRIVLEHQYDSMVRWVEQLAALARKSPGRGRILPRRLGGMENYIIDSGFHWGEWLRPGESMSRTYIKHQFRSPAVVATAYFAKSSRLLSDIARTLGHHDDAARYAALTENVRRAWCAAFVTRDGARIGGDRQDDYVRALAFDLLPEAQRPQALDRLVSLIEQAGGHLGTGFLSTAMLLPTLARFGRADVAFDLLLCDTNPSWLYQVKLGATTTWESWEGHDAKGNARYSHNHYALGAVAAWLVKAIAGITSVEPGYRRIRIKPLIGGGLTDASATIGTPFGRVRSAWRLQGDHVELTVTVPAGTSAEIHQGDGNIHSVGPGVHVTTWRQG